MRPIITTAGSHIMQKLSKYTFNNCFSINLEDKNKDYMRDAYISETASSEIIDETNKEVLRLL